MGAFDDIPTVAKSDPFADLPPAEKSSDEKPLKGSATGGAIEAALNVGTSALGAVTGGYYGLATGDPGAVEPITEAFTYQPRTERGKAMSKIASYPFEKLDQFAEYLGEKNREASGSPGFSAGVKAVVDALPMLLGRGRGRAAEAGAEKPAAEKVAQPPPKAAPPEREFPVADETPAVRPEGTIRGTKPAPGAEVVGAEKDPFADLPNAGNLEDVPAFQPKPAATPAAEIPPKLPHEDFEPTGTPEVEQRLRETIAQKDKEHFDLTGETPEQVHAKAVAAAKAKAKAEEARKAAAPPAEEFALAGSDRPADQAAARGQMELTEQPAAREETPAPKPRQRKEGPPASLLTTIKRLGGISSRELLDLTGESRATVRPGLFSRAGQPLDELATKLRVEEGFPIPEDAADGGVQALRDMIQDELNGRKKHYSLGDQDRIAQMERDREAKALAKEEAEFEKRTRGAQRKISDEEALETFGPGVLGMNAALNPDLIVQAAKDLKAGAKATFDETFGTPGEYRNLYGPIRDVEQRNVARIDRWAAGESHAIKQAFPSPNARSDLTEKIVRGDLSGLNGVQLEIARRLQKNYASMGEYAVRANQLDGLRQNYSPQIWDMNDKRTRAMIEMWREARDAGPIRESSPLVRDPSGSGMFSPFKLQRAISDVFEGMQMGLKPASMDAAELFTTYARSMGRAVERSKAMTSLHELMSDDGMPMVMPMKQAPRGYVPIRYPELEGYGVHPDIAPAVKVVLESDTPGAIGVALQSIAYASKRGLVSYSLFHPTSLFLAWEGSFPKGSMLNPKGAIDAALKKYREGGPGDAVDKLLAGGLKIGAPMEDIMGRERFTGVMDKVERVAKKVNLGSVVQVPRALDRKLQYATWDYVQTGFKLDLAVRFFEDQLVKNAGKIAKGEITEADIARQSAEAANAIQGGLNWERMIDKFDTPLGRRMISDILSKQGRRWAQTFMFAPDWLVSTTASWTNAVTGGEKAAVRRSLARRYLITSAIITYTYGNALNYYFTGHSMFENRSNKKGATWLDDMKAKTEVSLGGGLRINPNKHFLEVPHMAADPVQAVLNKANPLTVGEPLEQLFNKEWLSTGYAPPITKPGESAATRAGKRAKHAALKVAPITGRAAMEQGLPGVAGFFGFPVTGVSDEQKARERTQREIDRARRP